MPSTDRVPKVEILPFSVISKLGVEPDWISRAVWLSSRFVSLMTKALPVPELVKVKEVATPEFEEASYRVKAMSLAEVVVMVFPPVYAFCRLSV